MTYNLIILRRKRQIILSTSWCPMLLFWSSFYINYYIALLLDTLRYVSLDCWVCFVMSILRLLNVDQVYMYLGIYSPNMVLYYLFVTIHDVALLITQTW